MQRDDLTLMLEQMVECGEEFVRQEKSKPLLDEMHAWLLRERETLSRSTDSHRLSAARSPGWIDCLPPRCRRCRSTTCSSRLSSL